MSDEEMKRLKDACTGVTGGWTENGSSAPFIRFLNACTPEAVLALIERVRKAEANAKEWSERAGEWQQNAKDYARRAEKAEADVLNAERKGAEEMRERAAFVHDCQCASQGFSGLSSAPWHRRCAAEIRSLPLPGDAT